MDEQEFTIGEIAREAGIKTSAIRYYESRGVLPEPARQSGRRRYGPDTLRQLEIIAVAQRAGFSLEDVATLLASPDTEQLRMLAQRKLPDIEALIARAQAMRSWLEAASDCDCETLDVCALFESPAA